VQKSLMSTLFLIQFLNGLQLGVLLFLLAAGLTLVFGIMDFVNLAHGSLYMLGAFVCASLTFLTGSFVWGVLLAIPIIAVIGYFFEVLIVRHLYESNHLDHVLATFGIILIADTLVQLSWGPEGIAIPLPGYLSGQVEIFPGIIFPTFRLVIISSGLLIAAGLYWLITYTRLGMLIRAGASNRTMVSALGVDISTLFAGVFALGAVLAGVAGMLIAPITEATIGMGNDIIITAFVVIIVGGIGSMKGAFIAAILIGIIDTLGRSFLKDILELFIESGSAETAGPALSSMLIYIIMAVVLAVRPQGLFPPKVR
jgi:branched-chain amino acid transport system permease protein